MSQITELQVSYQAGVITGNFEEVKSSLQAKLEDYQNVVYTADTVKDAKKDVAELRKLRKVIDDKRKEIKKSWNDPYKAFEEMTKELITLIDEPINYISSQIDSFEEQRKAEKRSKIEEEYSKRFDNEYGEYCTLDSFFDEKWLNSSTTMKTIKELLDSKKTFIEESIKTIKDCGEETEEKALKMFKANLNLQEVLAWINQYRLQKEEILKNQREEEQDRQRKAEEERIRKEEQERQAKAEAERKEAEAKANNENMVKEMLQQPISQPGGFNIPTSQQGFASEVPPTNQGFDGFVTSSEPQPPQEQTGFNQSDNTFGGFQQEQQTGFVQSVQGFGGFAQPEQSPVNDTQPVQGFGVKQEELKKVVFTVRVPHEMANHFEGLITQWGYTDFDRR